MTTVAVLDGRRNAPLGLLTVAAMNRLWGTPKIGRRSYVYR